jgi:hypothetical protein
MPMLENLKNKNKIAFMHALFILFFAQSFVANAKPDLFYLGAKTYFEDAGDRIVNDKLLKEVGFNSYRADVWWSRLEWKTRGEYTFDTMKFMNGRFAPNALDYYIKSRQHLSPDNSSPAPLLILHAGNDQKFPDGFRYGTPFPPEANPTALTGFVNYVRAVVDHYKDNAPLFEVWNEWYHGSGSAGKTRENKYTPLFATSPCPAGHPYEYCWTDANIKDDKGNYINHTATMPENYVKLLKPTYMAIKLAAPNAKVLAVGGEIDDWAWIKRFVDAGGLDYTDGLAFHFYWDSVNKKDRSPEWALQLLDHIQLHLKSLVSLKTGKSKAEIDDIPLYITEVGISTYEGGNYFGEQGQTRAASELVRFLLMARSRSYVKGIWIHSLKDRIDSIPKERNFGLFTIARDPKVAVSVLQKNEVATALINGSNFECTVNDKPCQYDGLTDEGRHTWPRDGNEYVVSWKDKFGLHRSAKWKKNVNAAIIFSVNMRKKEY